jgi:hypothetical protein
MFCSNLTGTSASFALPITSASGCGRSRCTVRGMPCGANEPRPPVWVPICGKNLRNGTCWLPESQRAALVLRYQEDLTPEEIAVTLKAPLATVKSHLQRGLKLLRVKASQTLKEYVRGA